MHVNIIFSEPNFKMRTAEAKQYIYDRFRRKYVLLTPEEWVRQNLLSTLITNYAYPSGLIAVEKMLRINNLNKRYDAVVFDKNRSPWMLIECKAPEVILSEDTLMQTLNYYSMLQCPYLMISNGQHTHIAAIDSEGFSWLDSVPAYNL